jgi:hypothetical protein
MLSFVFGVSRRCLGCFQKLFGNLPRLYKDIPDGVWNVPNVVWDIKKWPKRPDYFDAPTARERLKSTIS